MPAVLSILKAPQLVIKEIINTADPGELLILSLCSKRMHRLIKLHRNKKIEWGLSVVDKPQPRLLMTYKWDCFKLLCNIEASKIQDRESIKFINFMGNSIPFKVNRDGIILYWDDEEYGMKMAITYISDLFEVEVTGLHFDTDNLWLMEWLKPGSLKYGHMERKEAFTDEKFENILKNCQPSEILSILTAAPDNFRFEGCISKTPSVSIWYGSWVTVDNLLAMENVELRISHSKFISLEFNRFLKLWIVGGYPQMKCLLIQIHGLDVGDVFKDIEEQVMFVEEKRSYLTPSGGEIFFESGFNIQNSEGVTATVDFDPDGSLYMVVWPEPTLFFC